MMTTLWQRLRASGGYTAVEAVIASSVMVFVLATSLTLMQVGYKMDKQSQDGFQAQNEGRQVLSNMAKLIRPAQNMNVGGVPQLYADNQGRYFDVLTDTNEDGKTELVRFDLDRTNNQIKVYIDYVDTGGLFNFQTQPSPQPTYLEYYQYPTVAANWDETKVMANKIVNMPPGGTPSTTWTAQRATTDPKADYRLFTFYGASFAAPLDTVELGSVWVNYVRGVKIFVLSDIQPADIPSPFGIQTNVNLRNITDT